MVAASSPNDRNIDRPKKTTPSALVADKQANSANKTQGPNFNDDLGCRPGSDDRRSDLCAQWKAADAAERSADWTRNTFWLGLAGTAIGGLTLAAAAFAAWWAKRAAEEAAKSAIAAHAQVEQAERLLNEQLRPWIFVKSIVIKSDHITYVI
ncbi:MAG: hypothetical protein ABW048_03190, partial [Sphingobium sp.]